MTLNRGYKRVKLWMTLLCASAVLAACQGKSGSDNDISSLETETIPENVMIDEDITTSDLTTESMSDAEKAAIDRFVYQEGDWNSVWTYFDAEGNEAGRVEGTENFSFLVDKHSQMLTNVIPSLKHTSYAMLAYSPAEKHVIFLNIGPGGDYWVMRNNPQTGVMISDPHLNADGSRTIQMFTTLNRTENSFQVVMEASNDGGETWTKGYEQTLTRIVYEDE